MQLACCLTKLPPPCSPAWCQQGNRTPHTDALSRGAVTGLALSHGRGHVFRALLESICFGTEHIFETMRGNGYAPTSVAVAGGATRSELWMQIHADVSNVPFILTKVGRRSLTQQLGGGWWLVGWWWMVDGGCYLAGSRAGGQPGRQAAGRAGRQPGAGSFRPWELKVGQPPVCQLLATAC